MQQVSAPRILLIVMLGCLVASLPLFVPISHMPGVTRTVVLAGAAMTLNVLIGNTGLLSMGQGLFVGLGAYAVAIGGVKFGLSIFSGLALGLLASVVLGGLVAAIALRARHLFFSLLTMAIGSVAYVFVTSSYQWTGGDDGLVGYPLPSWLQSDLEKHLFAVTVITAITIAILLILASPFGVAMRAVRDNPERVASLGANPKKVEFAAMVLAGALGTICGSVLAITDESVSPATTFSWMVSANLMVMVAVGGRSMFLGPILGVAIIESVRNYIQGFSEHSDLVVGGLIMCCAIAFPEGIGRTITDYVGRRGTGNRLGIFGTAKPLRGRGAR
jgi:branched-chain amino acid transport system permease protein